MHAEPRPPRLRGRPRASDSAATRDLILSAARDVFRDLGYEGTTNMRIATHAGLTRPSINYHFTSKRALFRTVVEVNLAVLERALGTAVETVSLRDRLRAVITATDADPQVRAATGFLTAAEFEFARHPELREDGWDVASVLRDFLTRSVTTALENGELRADVDATAMVDALHALLSGMAFRHGAIGDRGRRRAQSNAVIALITGDLFTEPSALRHDGHVRLA